MEKQYSFDISFPSVDFDLYMPRSELCQKTHHAHLISRGNEIEIRIYFQSKTYFDRKLSRWLSEGNWKKIGLKIQVENESVNDRVLKIDLSETHFLRYNTGSNQIKDNLNYVSIFIDSVKIYWNPEKEYKNSAEFYLNEAGFKMVSEFYTPLSCCDGKFKISRKNGTDSFFQFDKGEFRPEFKFVYSDSNSASETKIIKEPYLNFKLNKNVTEKETMEYAEIACFISSFYFHSLVDYSFARIHLSDKTITIKKVIEPQILKPTSTGLWGAKYYGDFNSFLQLDWQKSSFKNTMKLKKVIEKFNQSLMVNGSSEFLIRYNIIEICMGGHRKIKSQFNVILDKKDLDDKYDEALNILIETVDNNELEDFIIKWKNVKRNMIYKPMISPLEKFLQSQKLKPDEFPIKLNKLVQMRSDFTHGSINSIKPEQLEKANILLYRISIILILNLLGIDKWELDTEL